MLFIKKISNFLQCNIIGRVNFLNKKILSRVEKIDGIKKEIIIYMRGINAPIRMSYDEIIQDSDIINSFSPKQASIVGYYYGVYYFKLTKKTAYSNAFLNSFEISLLYHNSIYGIDRSGNLIYMERVHEKKITKLPSEIFLDQELICGFPPIQAFYIGILAGIEISKYNKKLNRNKLQLV